MKLKQLFVALLTWIVFFFLLETTGRYHFYYVEQFQLFRFASDYVLGQLAQVGGVAHLAGAFLTQFFVLPYAGALIISLLLTGITLSLRSIFQQISGKKHLFLLEYVIAICLLFTQYDYNYYLSGLVSYLFVTIAWVIWQQVRGLQNGIATGLFSLCLYYAIGPSALLFSAGLLLIGRVGSAHSFIPGLVSTGLNLLAAASSVWMVWNADYRFAFLPDAYYHPKLAPNSIIYATWWILLLGLLLAWALHRMAEPSGKAGRIGLFTLQLLLVGGLIFKGLPQFMDIKNYLMKELDHYTRTQQWDRVVQRLSQEPIKNFLYLNYLNLALTERGTLCDQLFAFNQRGPQSLLVPWNKSAQVSTLSSDIYFCIGEIGLSQQMAFEALIGADNPRNYQRLIETNLIYGHYAVAEKYIRRLEQSLFYRDWAEEHRQLLNRDDLVEADPVLGPRRRGLPEANHLSSLQNVEADLLTRAERVPQLQTALAFAGANLLLAKDMNGLEAFLKRFYQTPVLPTLPRAFQEAIIILSEAHPEVASHYQISEEMLSRFAQFKQQFLQNKQHPQLAQYMRQQFGSNYWIYYLFTNI